MTWHSDGIKWELSKQYYDTTMVNGIKHGSTMVYVQNAMVGPMIPCQKKKKRQLIFDYNTTIAYSFYNAQI